MIKITCRHDKKQKIIAYVDGKTYEPENQDYVSTFKFDLRQGKHEIILCQVSIFNSWYWWLTLIPCFWLIKGGLLLNYFLGYDAEFAQLKINICINSCNENIELEVVLENRTYLKSYESTTNRVYYEFELKKNSNFSYSNVGCNLHNFHIKWVASQLVLPILLLIGMLFCIIKSKNMPLDFGLILSLVIVFVLITERIVRVLMINTKDKELEKLKKKKQMNNKTR